MTGISSACPICNLDRHMAKAKPLYGTPVCSKCYYGFANRRQGAFAIDILLFRMAIFAGALVVGLVLAMLDAPEALMDGAGIILMVISMIVLPFKDGFGGHSPGKALLGIQTIHRDTGMPAGFMASFKRNLGTLIPFAPLVIAVQLCKGSRWGDDWAHTAVIWKKHRNKAPFAQFPNPTA